jgi:hypothetical protein
MDKVISLTYEQLGNFEYFILLNPDYLLFNLDYFNTNDLIHITSFFLFFLNLKFQEDSNLPTWISRQISRKNHVYGINSQKKNSFTFQFLRKLKHFFTQPKLPYAFLHVA